MDKAISRWYAGLPSACLPSGSMINRRAGLQWMIIVRHCPRLRVGP